MYQLFLRTPGEPVALKILGEVPLVLGRGSGSAVLLPEPSLARHHAVLWVDGGAVWVRDLGGVSGTFVNNERVHGVKAVAVGDVLRLGETTILEVRGERDPDRPALAVHDLATNARLPIRGDRFHIGASPESDLHLGAGPPWAATVMVDVLGGVSLSTPAGETPLAVDVAFPIGTRWLAVRRVERMPTEPPSGELPYRMVARVDRGEPMVRLADTEGRAFVVNHCRRALFLYILARRLCEHREAALPREDQGWCTSREVMTGLWGRNANNNRLHVLVYQLRKDLSHAGFDARFIEKNPGSYLRIALSDVAVELDS